MNPPLLSSQSALLQQRLPIPGRLGALWGPTWDPLAPWALLFGRRKVEKEQPPDTCNKRLRQVETLLGRLGGLLGSSWDV